MPSRSRSFDSRRILNGSVKVLSTGYTYRNVGALGESGTCDDVVGNREADNPLTVYRRIDAGEVLSGYVINAAGNKTRLVADLIPDGICAAFRPQDPRSMFPRPDFQVEAPAWVRRLMPLQPAVNLPAVIGESKDLPELITGLPEMILDWGRMRFGKHAGKAERAGKVARQAAQSVGTANLWYRFGMSPTVADALAMLGFMDSLRRALVELLALKHRGAVKRSLRLPPGRHLKEDGQMTTHSAGIVTRHNRVRVYNSRSWVTARWVPLIPGYYSSMGRDAIIDLAMKRLLGLSPSGLLDAWWELLPWSWLTDWFARIQRMLQLVGGLDLLLRLESFCYCRTVTMDVYWSPTSIPFDVKRTGDSHVCVVVKERIPLTVDVSSVGDPSFRGLSPAQIGILGALASALIPTISPSRKRKSGKKG